MKKFIFKFNKVQRFNKVNKVNIVNNKVNNKVKFNKVQLPLTKDELHHRILKDFV